MRRLLFCVAVLATVAVTGAVQASTVFSDGVFNDSDWTMTVINNAVGAGSTAGALQMPVGGNPNQYRIIRHQLLVSSQGTGAIFTFHMNNNAFYTPSSQGAISYIDYSEDDKNFLNQVGSGQSSGLAILQNGIFYRQQNPLLLMPYLGFSNWAGNAAPGLVAADFAEVDPLGNVLLASNPDFSATGTIMQLGFHRGNSGNGSYNTETGIDNWHVNVVPEPSMLVLVGIGAVGLLACVRRRRLSQR